MKYNVAADKVGLSELSQNRRQVISVKDWKMPYAAAPRTVQLRCSTVPSFLVQWHRPIFSQNLAMSVNNRFFPFLSTADHVIQESIGCNDYPRLAFSKFKMAAKMDAKSHYWL